VTLVTLKCSHNLPFTLVTLKCSRNLPPVTLVTLMTLKCRSVRFRRAHHTLVSCARPHQSSMYFSVISVTSVTAAASDAEMQP
jgi:hypothetical protein